MDKRIFISIAIGVILGGVIYLLPGVYNVSGVAEIVDLRENIIILELNNEEIEINKNTQEYLPLSLKIGDKVEIEVKNTFAKSKITVDMGWIFFGAKTNIIKKDNFLKNDFEWLDGKEVVIRYSKDGNLLEKNVIIDSCTSSDLITDSEKIRLENISILIYPRNYE